MEISVLENKEGRGAGGRAAVSITAAWCAVGLAGRVALVVAAGACLVATAALVGSSPAAVATGAALLVLLAAALVDAVERRLPNELVALAACPVAVAVVTDLVLASTALAWGALAGAAVVGVPLLLTHLASPAGMGFGDVKAGIVLGAALGLLDYRLALIALVLGLATGAVWGLSRRARSIALGPALVAGAIAALAIGAVIGVEAW